MLKDLNNKLVLAEYKKVCYTEEYMDLVPLHAIRNYYNNVNFNNLNINKNNLNK